MSALKNKYCHLLFGVFKGVNTSYDICICLMSVIHINEIIKKKKNKIFFLILHLTLFDINALGPTMLKH